MGKKITISTDRLEALRDDVDDILYSRCTAREYLMAYNEVVVAIKRHLDIDVDRKD